MYNYLRAECLRIKFHVADHINNCTPDRGMTSLSSHYTITKHSHNCSLYYQLLRLLPSRLDTRTSPTLWTLRLQISPTPNSCHPRLLRAARRNGPIHQTSVHQLLWHSYNATADWWELVKEAGTLQLIDHSPYPHKEPKANVDWWNASRNSSTLISRSFLSTSSTLSISQHSPSFTPWLSPLLSLLNISLSSSARCSPLLTSFHFAKLFDVTQHVYVTVPACCRIHYATCLLVYSRYVVLACGRVCYATCEYHVPAFDRIRFTTTRVVPARVRCSYLWELVVEYAHSTNSKPLRIISYKIY